MDRTDDVLRQMFVVPAPPTLAERVQAALRAPAPTLKALADRFHFEAGERGIRRLRYGRGHDVAAGRARRYVEQAREELAEYLAGGRTFFSVPIDLRGIGEFQDQVLTRAREIPYGEVTSYAAIARGIGHPRASRAVGNALGANPVPVPSRYRFLPGRRLSRISVPVGLRPTRMRSPSCRCRSRDVSGPSGTLMEKNSSWSS